MIFCGFVTTSGPFHIANNNLMHWWYKNINKSHFKVKAAKTIEKNKPWLQVWKGTCMNVTYHPNLQTHSFCLKNIKDTLLPALVLNVDEGRWNWNSTLIIWCYNSLVYQWSVELDWSLTATAAAACTHLYESEVSEKMLFFNLGELTLYKVQLSYSYF